MKEREQLLKIDMNCDMGEGYGRYTLGNDEALLTKVTSANIACGFHAGDPLIMMKTVKMCLEKGVAIGAHPGLPDLAGFGRREMAVHANEVHAMTLYQVGALQAIAQSEGGRLHHVKPHGALYNMAAFRADLAEAIAEAVYKLEPELILYGLAGSVMLEVAERIGLKTASEGFVDRRYLRNGTLASRQEDGAVIETMEEAVRQGVRLARGQAIETVDGAEVQLAVDTLCIHGDGVQALQFAGQLRQALLEEGFVLAAC